MTLIVSAFAVAAIVIIGTDIYLAKTKGWTATLSYRAMLLSVQYPIIPAISGFIIGLLFGHLFWSQQLNVTVPCPVSQ